MLLVPQSFEHMLNELKEKGFFQKRRYEGHRSVDVDQVLDRLKSLDEKMQICVLSDGSADGAIFFDPSKLTKDEVRIATEAENLQAMHEVFKDD